MPLINIAALMGYTDIINLLISIIGCAEIEATNESIIPGLTKTPLFFAVSEGHYEATKLLLDCGCSVNR